MEPVQTRTGVSPCNRSRTLGVPQRFAYVAAGCHAPSPLCCTSILVLPFLLVGTTLAAIVGGQTVGVAPEAQLKCIKVQKDGQEADVRDIISGIQLAVERASDNTAIPSVILVPYSFPANQQLDDAVRIPTVSWNDTEILRCASQVPKAIAKGILVIVQAGAHSQDAKGFSPGRVPDVISVGATDISDKMADFANFGQSITLFAPGVNVFTSALTGSPIMSTGTPSAV